MHDRLVYEERLFSWLTREGVAEELFLWVDEIAAVLEFEIIQCLGL